MLGYVFQPGGQPDTDTAQETTFDSLSGMIIYADESAFGQ